MFLLANGSPLPSEIREPCFPCSASVGHMEVPFQGRREADPNPYTTVHPYRARARITRRGCARNPEIARMRCEISFPMAGSGVPGAQGDGGIQGDAAALELLGFLAGMRLS